MRINRTIALARFAIAASVALPAAVHAQAGGKPDVTGKWSFAVQSDAGTGTPTVTIKQQGDSQPERLVPFHKKQLALIGLSSLQDSADGDRRLVKDFVAKTVKQPEQITPGLPLFLSYGLPCQSVRPSGISLVMPSHQISLSAVTATFVNIVLLLMLSIALGLVFALVPGATPKYPASGFMAFNFPFSSL